MTLSRCRYNKTRVLLTLHEALNFARMQGTHNLMFRANGRRNNMQLLN